MTGRRGRGSTPCLNRVKMRECIDALGVRVIQSDGLGIEIERYANHIGYQRWRVHGGGGIAGNSNTAWLAPVSRSATHESPRGPFHTKAQLTKALRVWRKEHRGCW